MVLPSFGQQISLADIQKEYGGSDPIQLSEYHRNPSDDVDNSSYVKSKLPGSGPATGGNNPNTVNIPTSQNQIGFDQFNDSYSLLGFNRYLSTAYNISLHFYTANPGQEILGAPNNYNLEGSPNYFYIHGGPVFPNTTDLHRFFNNSQNGGGPHLFTTVKSEGDNAGFSYEGIVGYVYTYQAPNTQPIYRGTSNNGDFLYTYDQNEIGNAGYQTNGVAFYAFTSTDWW